ncbi:MAG: hypothetical protein H0U36_03685 [Nocardioidaceae bacterium]|nr:hypothetical protein [Nocardioidaceae bacterium]
MAAQYGPHRWSDGYHHDGNNAAFRAATFMVADLAGAGFSGIVDGLTDVELERRRSATIIGSRSASLRCSKPGSRCFWWPST